MKRVTFLFLSLLASITVHLNAQSLLANSKRAIGITYSGLGANHAFYFKSLDGAGAYHDRGYYSLGITYIHPVTQSFDIEAGVNYNNYTYQFSNASLGPDAPDPYEVKNTIIDIPVTLRWNFLNYFFLNGGLSIGIDTGKHNHLDSQTGIGAMIGVGAKYNLKSAPVGFFVNPYYKLHTLIRFSLNNHHMHADESGFRFGILYHLP